MKPSIILGALLAFTAAYAHAANSAMDYKGRRITAAEGGKADECVALLRKAIDMAGTLPAKQRSLAAEVKDLRCLPLDDAQRTNAVADNTIGIYTVASPNSADGYIRFPLNATRLSAAEVVMSLVGNGHYARWHHAYLAAKAKGDPSAQHYRAILTHSDQKAMNVAECQMLDDRRAVAKALDLGDRWLTSIDRQSKLRACP